MKHDHRKYTWLICGGLVIWCRKCGTWRLNHQKKDVIVRADTAQMKGWVRPGSQERAMKDSERAISK